MSDAKKVEEKKPAEVQDIASIVAKTVEGLLPALLLAGQPKTQYVSDTKLPKERCGECGQVKSGCQGKHVQMSVYPQRRPEYADCFTGVTLNGVKYYSDSPDIKVVVPENAAGWIQSRIDEYEENEVQTRNGRNKQKNRPGPVKPAIDGWR